MKYGLIPTRLGERLALWAGKVPVPLLDCVFPLLQTRSLMAAVSLGLFEALREGPRTAAAAAEGRGLDAGAAEDLMRMLVHSGYLDWAEGRFRLSSLSRKTMIRGAPREMTASVRWNYVQWEMLGRLEDMVRSGKGLDFHSTMKDPERWACYQGSMLELARFESPLLASRVPVRPGATRLLDVAGAHGLFGAALCRRHPPMKAEVLDLPEALEHAVPLARAEGIGDVVAHRAGDLRRDAFGGPYDVVLMCNILHHFAPEENREWIGKARRALGKNGTFAIWEFETPHPGSPPTEGAAAALFFRLTSSARSYSGTEYAAWVRDAGFREVRVARPILSPGTVLVTGRA